jgi:tRNA pseudouridine38-40 synthase
MERNIILILSYLGTEFAGWQKTAFKMSIEQSLENALERILREKPKLQAASRTDAGVHAKGQVVNFFTENPIDLTLLQRALNGTLPKEISVLSIEATTLCFHPTLDCIKKEYHYTICNSRVQLPIYRLISWHVPQELDLEKMRFAATSLLGSHDFSAFCNERKRYDRNPVCQLDAISLQELPHNRLCLTVVGDHFLYKMVRTIVGTLVDVGKGKRHAEDMAEILKNKERKIAGVTAPAHGLCLFKVYYKS